MSNFREYRGLFGEVIRVAESSIVSAPYSHNSVRYPFSVIASRAGSRRDTFASFALSRNLIDEALKHPRTRMDLARAQEG